MLKVMLRGVTGGDSRKKVLRDVVGEWTGSWSDEAPAAEGGCLRFELESDIGEELRCFTGSPRKSEGLRRVYKSDFHVPSLNPGSRSSFL